MFNQGDVRGSKDLFKVTTWKESTGDTRLGPPVHSAFPINTTWKLYDREAKLEALSIKFSTTAKQEKKMKPPPAEEGWSSRLQGITLPFPAIWKLKPMYVTPRDMLPWLKLMT